MFSSQMRHENLILIRSINLAWIWTASLSLLFIETLSLFHKNHFAIIVFFKLGRGATEGVLQLHEVQFLVRCAPSIATMRNFQFPAC